MTGVIAEKGREFVHAAEESEKSARAAEFWAALFQGVCDHIPLAIVVADPQQQIVYTNAATDRLFGYSGGELAGKHLNILIPERFQSAHNKGYSDVQETQDAIDVGFGRNLEGLRKPGKNGISRTIPITITLGIIPMKVDEFTLIFAAAVIQRTGRAASEDK